MSSCPLKRCHFKRKVVFSGDMLVFRGVDGLSIPSIQTAKTRPINCLDLGTAEPCTSGLAHLDVPFETQGVFVVLLLYLLIFLCFLSLSIGD